jgi:hypothetical protein
MVGKHSGEKERKLGFLESDDVNWLPHNTNLSPIASLKQQPSHKVSELIDGTSSSWRPDLIRETFLPMDVSIIIKYSIAYKNTN